MRERETEREREGGMESERGRIDRERCGIRNRERVREKEIKGDRERHRKMREN